MEERDKIEKIEGQQCPICKQNTLILTQIERDIPFFGRILLMSMSCKNCLYHAADVEILDRKEPARYEIIIEKPEDLNILVVRSSAGRVLLKRIGSIEPGINNNGFITTIEGVINRIKRSIEQLLPDLDGEKEKKARMLIKKINRILSGWDKAVLVVEDPTGNSAIISDKAKKTSLKKKS